VAEVVERGALLAAKLRGLVGDRVAGPVPADFAGGAALVSGDEAWVLLDRDPLGALGAAMVWADRRGATSLALVAEADAPLVARRAALFSRPPRVWTVEGRELLPVDAAPPAVHPRPQPAPELAALLVDADLEIVIEEGIVRAEVLGLEVARIVHGTTTAGTPIDEPVLEVGVGHADREMTAVVHGGLPPVDQLHRVAEIVGAQRRPDAARHPLNQLAPERWLRSRVNADPARIGLRSLRSAPPAVARPNLRDPSVAFGLGVDQAGGDVVVAFSVGVRLDLVPAAADARLALAPEAPLLLVVPERDAHPVTHALAARLCRPARVVTVQDDWRS